MIDTKKLYDAALVRFKALCADVPEADRNAYAVYSSPAGQCEITLDAAHIFDDFPAFFADDAAKQRASELKKELLRLSESVKKSDSASLAEGLRQAETRFAAALRTLTLDARVFVELRFKTLDYGLIARLKRHPLVHQPEELMSAASIRVVLDAARVFAAGKEHEV
ncbi:MAG: hypothetical protein AABZ39_14250 [Spirochaetota bacterium]